MRHAIHAVLTALLLAAATGPSTAATPSRIDWASVELHSLDGGRAPATRHAGQPVLLQFWSSGCHSCGGLMWDLDAIGGRFPSVTYSAVSIDPSVDDAMQRIAGHALFEQHPQRFLHDAGGSLAARLDVRVVPTMVVLAADGEPLWRHVGHANSSDLQQLRSVLAEIAQRPGRLDP